MKKIKVVYLLTSCKRRGPTNQTLNIIKYLDRSIFEPILVTLYAENNHDSILPQYLSEVCKHLEVESSAKHLLLGIDRSKFYKILDTSQVDIVHSVGLVPSILAQKYKNASHITTIRNYVYEDYSVKYGTVLGWLMAIINTIVIRNCKHAYVCSQSLSDKYKRKLNINLPFIRNGVDMKSYYIKGEDTALYMREKLGLPKDKIILIYTGQFNLIKDQEFVVHTLMDNPLAEEICLLLLGNGATYLEMKNKYGKYNNVVFTGEVSNVSEYLLAADIYVSSSKSEGLPNAVLEAMSTGLPVLLSDIPQHHEIYDINPHIGRIYKLGDERDFIRQLKTILTGNLKEMGLYSNKVVGEYFSAELMSQQYQNLYRQIVNELS